MKNLIFFLLLLSNGAFACYCTDTPLIERLEDSDYAYLGQVTVSSLNEGVVSNTLKIEELIKGSPDQLQVINNLFPEDMCASHMVVGYKYIVFGKLGSTPEISSCSYTRSLQTIGLEGLEKLRKSSNDNAAK